MESKEEDDASCAAVALIVSAVLVAVDKVKDEILKEEARSDDRAGEGFPVHLPTTFVVD